MAREVFTATQTITLGSIVLLSVADGDDMESEPQWQRTQELQIRKPIEAAAVKPKGRALVQRQLSFSRIKYHADPVEARAWIASHDIALPTAEAALTVANEGGVAYTLSDCVLTSVQATSEHSTTSTRYQITGGALA